MKIRRSFGRLQAPFLTNIGGCLASTGLILGACAGPESPEPVSVAQIGQVPWTLLTEAPIDGSGLSAWVEAPIEPLRRYTAIRATPARVDPPVCVRLEPVELASGPVWVAPWRLGDDNAVCERCSNPVVSQPGYGTFVLPSAPTAVAQSDTLRLRIQLLDCVLQIPVSRARRPELPATVTVEVAEELESPESRGKLRVKIARLGDAISAFGSNDDPAWVFAASRFAEAGVDLALADVADLESQGPLSWAEDQRDELQTAFDALSLHFGDEDLRYVPVITARCLHPSNGPSIPGFTSRIPGGLSPSGLDSAVFLSLGCEGQEVDIESLGIVFAHELGHYLGLFHSDTPAGSLAAPGGSLMGSRPLGVEPRLRKFTPEQARIMRRHPDLILD
ncbi:MAG: hypothetical protein HY791_22150 [Deltaproteobacteria bacterium]|nr:hypothetical protein [Deltaproteobacteria bacterium]